MARRFVGSALVEWGLAPDDVVLVVSELAANAVRHARSGFEVSLRPLDGAVVVEVNDASPQMPWAGTPCSGAPGGRGLVIVNGLARAWGSRAGLDGGKTVWAEVPTT